MKPCVCLMAIAYAFGTAPVSAGVDAARLELNLSFSKTTYLLKEPVKLTAVLKNVSDDPVRVVEVSQLTLTDTEFLYLEIETPRGVVERRQTHNRIDRSYPKGEPLEPGDSITIILYPSLTVPIDRDATGYTGLTFSQPGSYRVVLVYMVGDNQGLRPEPTGELRSNEVRLTIRAPDDVESEILDSLWQWCHSSLWDGETGFSPCEDVDSLRSLIDAYPDHDLIPYLRYFYAMTKMWTHKFGLSKAVDELSRLMEQHPTFRPQETRLLSGVMYRRLKKQDEAFAVMSSLFAQYPNLRSSYPFMWRQLILQYDDTRAISIWQENRRRGVAEPDNIDLDAYYRDLLETHKGH